MYQAEGWAHPVNVTVNILLFPLVGMLLPFLILQSPVLSFPSQAPISADNEAEQPADVMQYGLIVYLMTNFFSFLLQSTQKPWNDTER